ncbi:MAG: hypothetical protein KDN22_31620, partial [Verrucomicrobiae bacterium]|nr:hypothetical protein [Verrucomicrobiae bacterium]
MWELRQIGMHPADVDVTSLGEHVGTDVVSSLPSRGRTTSRREHHEPFEFEQFEERILLSAADAAATLAESGDGNDDSQQQIAMPADLDFDSIGAAGSGGGLFDFDIDGFETQDEEQATGEPGDRLDANFENDDDPTSDGASEDDTLKFTEPGDSHEQSSDGWLLNDADDAMEDEDPPVVLALTSTWSGTIASNTTWSDTIEVSNNLTIASGVTLTIEPGTVIKTRPGIWIVSSGILNVNGTEAEPVIFTSTHDDSVGDDLTGGGVSTVDEGEYWESLYIDGGGTINNAEFRFAGDNNGGFGGGGLPSLQFRSAASPTLNNVTVKTVKEDGVYASGSSKPTYNNVHVENTGGVAFASELSSSPTFAAVSAAGAGIHAIQWTGGTHFVDRTFNVTNLPYIFTGSDDVLRVGTGATLTLDPGVVLKFASNQYFITQADGTLRASGTAGQKIVFTSRADDSALGDTFNDGETVGVPGQWESVYLDGAATLQNVEIRYAGDNNGGFGGGQVASLHVRAASAAQLTNVVIRDGWEDGIDISTSSAPVLTNVTVQDSLGVAFDVAFAANPVFNSIASLRNGIDAIHWREGRLVDGVTRRFNVTNMPYIFAGS